MKHSTKLQRLPRVKTAPVHRMPAWVNCRSDKIYLFWAEGTPYFKIGYSNAPLKLRLGEIQVSCPLSVQFICAAYGDKTDERRIHLLLKDLRVRGEWFDFRGHADLFGSVLQAFGVRFE